MEKPANHACFEAAVADLLDQLYRSFPAPLSVDFEKAFAAAKLRELMPDHCKASFTHFNSLYGSTLGFLEREGVVFVKKLDDFKASGVVLTSKGFLLLNRPEPEATGEPATMGQRMGEIGKIAGTEALKLLIGRSVGHFFAALTS